jgi:hypothetical protein
VPAAAPTEHKLVAPARGGHPPVAAHQFRNGSRVRPRDWSPYAHALDLHLAGVSMANIGMAMGVTKARASQLVGIAKRQLAFRFFKGVPRPLPD